MDEKKYIVPENLAVKELSPIPLELTFKRRDDEELIPRESINEEG